MCKETHEIVLVVARDARWMWMFTCTQLFLLAERVRDFLATEEKIKALVIYCWWSPDKNATTRMTVAGMITHPNARLLAAFKNSVEIDKDAFLDGDGKSGEWWALSL